MTIFKEKQKLGGNNPQRDSLKCSVNEGISRSVMSGFGDSFFSPFAIFLKATTSQLALLSSLPLLFGSLSQLFAPKFLEHLKSRKKIVAAGILLQTLVWLPILYATYFKIISVAYLTLFVVVYWVAGMFINPAWNSWMGDIVEVRISNRYFAFRNKVVGIVALTSMLLAGLILNGFQKNPDLTFLGFVFIFSIALISGVISLVYILKKYEPGFVVYEDAKFTFVEFIKQIHSRNYGLFVIYLSLMNFSVYISAPFFSLYMIEDLKFPYLTFTLLTASSIFAKVIFMPFWGRLIDKYGSKKILSFTGYMMPLSPLLWLLSTKISYLFLFQLYSGLMWAGFELAASNFIFDATTSSKRARCIAYYNVINGVMILAGTMFGAFLVSNAFYLPPFLFVFFASGMLRLLVSVFMISRVREVRSVADVSYDQLLFQVAWSLPSEGLNTISVWAKKLKPFKKF